MSADNHTWTHEWQQLGKLVDELREAREHIARHEVELVALREDKARIDEACEAVERAQHEVVIAGTASMTPMLRLIARIDSLRSMRAARRAEDRHGDV